MVRQWKEAPIQQKSKWVQEETEGERQDRELRERDAREEAKLSSSEAAFARERRSRELGKEIKRHDYGVKKETELHEHPIKARLSYGVRESPQTAKRTGGRLLKYGRGLSSEASEAYGTGRREAEVSVRKRSKAGRASPGLKRRPAQPMEQSYMGSALAEFGRPSQPQQPQGEQPRPAMDFFGEKKNIDFFGNGTKKNTKVRYY